MHSRWLPEKISVKSQTISQDSLLISSLQLNISQSDYAFSVNARRIPLANAWQTLGFLPKNQGFRWMLGEQWTISLSVFQQMFCEPYKVATSFGECSASNAKWQKLFGECFAIATAKKCVFFGEFFAISRLGQLFSEQSPHIRRNIQGLLKFAMHSRIIRHAFTDEGNCDKVTQVTLYPHVV